MKYFFVAILIAFSGLSVFSQTTREDGIDLYRNGSYDKAADVLKAVTATDKTDRFAWLYLGASLFRSGHSKEAGAAFSKGTAKVEEHVPGDETAVSKFAKPRPHYTDMAKQNMTVGIVRMAVELGSDGKIGFIYLLHSLPNGLTEQSIAAAKSITFTPATKKGKSVPTVAVVEYTFDIR